MCLGTEAQSRPAQHRRAEIAEADDGIAPAPIFVLIDDEPPDSGANERAMVAAGGALVQRQRHYCRCRRERAACEASLPVAGAVSAVEQPCAQRVDGAIERRGVVGHAGAAAVRWPSVSSP